MAKLLYVGRNEKNLNGHSSKAYTIRRQGKKVIARWGAVQVIGGGGGKVEWLGKGPQKTEWSFRSVKAAVQFRDKQTAKKEQEGYERLPGRVGIR
ncbi:hypothetical protein KQH29_01000 [bacterium]|nr:hypothetical protein [bacterium]